MNIWVVSLFGVLWAILLSTLIYKFLHGHIFITLGCLYLGVELLDHVVVIQPLGCVQLFATPWTAAHWATLSFTISQSLLKLMSIESTESCPLSPLNYGWRFMTGGSDQDHLQEKEMQKCKMLVWGGLTNSWEKRSERQMSKGKIYPFKLHLIAFSLLLCLVAQWYPALGDPMDCRLPDPSVHGILWARILEWVRHFLLHGIFPTQGSNPHLLIGR